VRTRVRVHVVLFCGGWDTHSHTGTERKEYKKTHKQITICTQDFAAFPLSIAAMRSYSSFPRSRLSATEWDRIFAWGAATACLAAYSILTVKLMQRVNEAFPGAFHPVYALMFLQPLLALIISLLRNSWPTAQLLPRHVLLGFAIVSESFCLLTAMLMLPFPVVLIISSCQVIPITYWDSLRSGISSPVSDLVAIGAMCCGAFLIGKLAETDETASSARWLLFAAFLFGALAHGIRDISMSLASFGSDDCLVWGHLCAVILLSVMALISGEFADAAAYFAKNWDVTMLTVAISVMYGIAQNALAWKLDQDSSLTMAHLLSARSYLSGVISALTETYRPSNADILGAILILLGLIFELIANFRHYSRRLMH
jgi:hypothetical protein